MRKRKFGLPLSESAKKLARAARFNMDDTNSSSASSIKTTEVIFSNFVIVSNLILINFSN